MGQRILNGHQDNIRNGMVGNLDVGSVFSQTGTFTVWTGGPSAESRKHYPILDFVHFASHELKEIIQPFKVFIPSPQQRLLVFVKILVSPVNGKIKLDPVFHKRFQPFASGFTPPGSNGTLIDRKTFVRNHQVGIQAQHRSKSLACPTGFIRIVEAEKIYGRQLKDHSVQFETVGKGLSLLARNKNEALTMSFEKCRLDTVGDPILVVLILFAYHCTVN